MLIFVIMKKGHLGYQQKQELKVYMNDDHTEKL